MNRYFVNNEQHTGDLFVVDYTEQTKNTSNKRGVEFHLQLPVDIKGLAIINRNCVKFTAVNLEKNSLLDDMNCKISQCECLCAADKTDGEKGWLLLAELKYGLEKNNNSNLKQAYKQIESVHKYLIDKGILSNHRIYYIVSLPNSDNAPFERFKYTPAELTELKRRTGVTFRGVNIVEIRDTKRLKV